jgi:uncharacterized protein YbaA (DUF1428 family)
MKKTIAIRVAPETKKEIEELVREYARHIEHIGKHVFELEQLADEIKQNGNIDNISRAIKVISDDLIVNSFKEFASTAHRAWESIERRVEKQHGENGSKRLFEIWWNTDSRL